MLYHAEVLDFAFDTTSAPSDKGAIGLQRFDQLQDAPHVVDRCLAQFFEIVRGNHGPHTVVREYFEHRAAVDCKRYQMRARDAGTDGTKREAQIHDHVRLKALTHQKPMGRW